MAQGVTPELRLLLIDDDPAFYRAVKEIAEPHGFEVAAAEASRIYKSTIRSWSPTLVLVDLKTRYLDGVEILKGLAAIKCTAAIVLASDLDPGTLDAALRLGGERGLKMDSVLQKPASPHELNELLLRHKPAQ